MARPRYAELALATCLTASAAGCEATIGEAPLSSEDAASRSADAATATADASVPPVDASSSEPDSEPAPDAVVVQPDARPPCDGGDAQTTDPETDHCYELYGLSDGVATFEDASARCEDVGAHLAVITSPEEDALVLDLVFDTSGVQPDYWLGGLQPAGSAEPAGGWEWVTGESIVRGEAIYENWRDDEPNDGGDSGEDCLIIEGDVGGTWDDRDCGDGYPFVCERE